METFLALLDQFRYMGGSLVILWMMCHAALPRRERFGLRIGAASAACLALAFIYVPLEHWLRPYLGARPYLIGPYWIVMSAVLIFHVLVCYEAGLNTALFYVMMTSFTENIVTALIRNLLVYTFFPSFPEERPLIYLMVMVIVYTLFCYAVKKVLIARLRAEEGAWLNEGRGTTFLYLFVYAAYMAIMFATKHLTEDVIRPLAGYPELFSIYRGLQLFLVGVLILLSVVMTTVMWYINRRMALQAENEVIRRLNRERQSQYEFSRENIEMINRKSHDLKHQLQALEMVSDEERRAQLEETRRAIGFYDAVVKTGNEALDTLLTEKSVYCANRGIRLTCMVNTENLKKISLVDLYTLLGNALDNAIESVERIGETDKKTVSLTIVDRGNLLYIQIENYFDGGIRLVDGLPQTRKPDRENHGYGVKSIRGIVRRYGGSMDISTEGQIFSLEMIIPT